MAKLMLKGWFQEVGQPKMVGKNKDFEVQDVVFVIPGYEDRMTQQTRPDEPWIMQVKRKRVKELNLSEKDHEKRATVTVFIEGYAIEKTDTKPAYMGYQVTLHQVEYFIPGA